MSYIPSELKLTDGTTHGQISIVPNNLQILNSDETGNILMSVGVEVPENTILISAPNVVLRADNLTTRNTLDTINYELRPNSQPSNNQIMQWQSTGQVSWIPTPSGGGATDAFINSDPLTVPIAGSVLISDGTDPFNSTASDSIQVRPDGVVQLGNLGNSVLINSGDNGSAGLQIGDASRKILNDGTELIMTNSVGSTNISSRDTVSLDSGTSNIIMRSIDGVDIRQAITNKFTKLQQTDDNFSITNANANGNIDINTTNGDAKLRVNGSGIVINDSASIYNNSGNLYNTTTGTLIYQAGVNVNYDTPNGGTTFHTRDPITIQEYTTNAYTTLNQINDGNFSITNANTDANINIDTNGTGRVQLNGNGLTLNNTAIISNEGSYLYVRHQTGSLVFAAPPSGSITFQSRNPILIQETDGYRLSQLFQRNNGTFSIINQNADSNIELNAPNGGITVNTANGLTFNDIGDINNSGSDLQVSNGSGNVILTSKNNDVVVITEAGKFQVNQQSEFQGDMTINKVDPQINFNNTDYPTQLCNIAFESATQELIMEHHSPDLASKCNIRLGTNDINIQSTFSALNAGNINLETGTGYTFINQYKLPNVNPLADGQLLSCDIDGTSSWVSSPIPQTTYTYWVSNQGLDTNNGSIINPFLTVGRAITEANTLLDTDKVVINVMAGQYNEFSGITITKNNITINGGTSIPSQTVFDGVITYAIDNTGVADVASSLYGLTVRGVIYAGSSANNGSYVLGACILGTLQSGIVPIVNSYTLAGNRDITVSNCVVYAYDTHALTTVSGRINATATLFTQSSLVLNNTSAVLEATGNGLLALFGCQAFSLNAQATDVPPIISLANTIAPSSSHTFNSCTIQYVFATINTGTLNKVCIGCTNTVGISILAYNNLLIGEGTRITNGGVQYVIISKQGAGAVVLQYGQNLCGATVHRYATALSKTQLVTAIA